MIRLPLALAFVFGVVALTLQPIQPAQADSVPTTSCGQAVCFVETTVRGESDWQNEVDDTTVGGGGTSAPSPFKNEVHLCDSWLPKSGGVGVGSYPADNSSSYVCNFRDGGTSSGGSGTTWFQCPPLTDRAANGRVDRYIVDKDGKATFAYFYCMYPTDDYAPIERELGRGKIYTGGQGDFYRTGSGSSAKQASTSGTLTDSTGYVDRGVKLSNPEAYTGSWQPKFQAKTGTTAAGKPLYGYYRLLWKLDSRICIKYGYPSWLNEPTRYDCSQKVQDVIVNPFTYACDSNPALAAGVRSNAKFDPAACESGWTCAVSSPMKVGGQTKAITVMRNGEGVPVVNPAGKVTKHGADIRNVGHWQTFSTINAGSDPDDPDEYQASWEWDKWETYSKDADIAFYWATEPKGSFRWKTAYRFQAEFYVPTQAHVDGGTTYKWVMSTGKCGSTQSAPVSVVRSVNSPSDN